MKEVWMNIDGVHKYYQVSNLGRVRSLNPKWGGKEKIVKHFLTKGYHRVAIYDENYNRKKFLVHRLVAIAFLKNTENKKEVNHEDGDKDNNSLKNLKWVTPAENIQHAVRNKLNIAPMGEDNKMSKLTEMQVLTARTLPQEMLSKYAKQLGVSLGTIARAYSGVTWKHLPSPKKYISKEVKKLTAKDVIEIKKMLNDGLTHREIASYFPVHQSTISKIATGTRWKNVRI